jgi:hypothetical protein
MRMTAMIGTGLIATPTAWPRMSPIAAPMAHSHSLVVLVTVHADGVGKVLLCNLRTHGVASGAILVSIVSRLFWLGQLTNQLRGTGLGVAGF